MQMIDVLKRLAELDSENPRVEKTMTTEKSLMTVRDKKINESLGECGMGGITPPMPSTPATLNITASSGDEVSNMLKTIMSLAGLKPASEEPAFMGTHQEIELEPAHDAEVDHGEELSSDEEGDEETDDIEVMKAPGSAGEEMGKAISIIDNLNSDKDTLEDYEEDHSEERNYDNSPGEKVEPHKFGDDKVTPKQNEPEKKNGGGNPYRNAQESFDRTSANLLKAYAEFKKGK